MRDSVNGNVTNHVNVVIILLDNGLLCDFFNLCFLEGMKMRGSKPDSNGSQKLLSKEVSLLSVNICQHHLI